MYYNQIKTDDKFWKQSIFYLNYLDEPERLERERYRPVEKLRVQESMKWYFKNTNATLHRCDIDIENEQQDSEEEDEHGRKYEAKYCRSYTDEQIKEDNAFNMDDVNLIFIRAQEYKKKIVAVTKKPAFK